MGCSLGCIRRSRKYRKITETVVLETDEEETWGVYWFREVPKTAPRRRPSGGEAMERLHRFSALTEDKTCEALGTSPAQPEWRPIGEVPEHNFEMWAPRRKATKRAATMTVPHLYAEEIARAFWDEDPDVKAEWDPTVETFDVRERLADNAFVAHTVFKPVWPATQRDCGKSCPFYSIFSVVCL